MTALLRDRELGIITPIQYRFARIEYLYSSLSYISNPPYFPRDTSEHAVNSLSLEQTDYRYLLSGNADSSIQLWDLESTAKKSEYDDEKYEMVGQIRRKEGHDFGVSKVQWWPSDTGLFVTGSFDKSLKIWDTNQLSEEYKFDVNAKIYSFDMSKTLQHSTIAVGSENSFIRLVDLRSASSAQTISGHEGSVLSTKWSPIDSFIFASGSSDGEVRIWDIRRSKSCVCALDMHRVKEKRTPVPIVHGNINRSDKYSQKPRVKAHAGAVNGLCWADDGSHLISTGIDDKIRVWDLAPIGGVNKQVNFGPLVKNKHLQNLDPILSPIEETEEQYLLFPSNSGEVLIFTATDGKLCKRLTQGVTAPRSCNIVYRGLGSAKYYTGTVDGKISIWGPRIRDEDDEEEDSEIDQNFFSEDDEGEKSGRKSERDVQDESNIRKKLRRNEGFT